MRHGQVVNVSSNMNSLTKGVSQVWAGLNKTQKTMVASGALLALVVSLTMIVISSRGASYEVLWSNLDPLDGGAILTELERQSIPYKLSGTGTIMVPSDQVHRTRLTLASQGLPASGVVGFESMSTKGVFATDFERKVQYVRALSGELARTIKTISAVEDARVHIVMPESSLFASQKQPATAAVLVKLRPMMELSASSVNGIVHLVASSVEGLSTEEVTVIDAQGKLLSQDYGSLFPGGESLQASGALFELTTKVERELERRLVLLLSPVMGAGNVACQVRAALNTDQVKVTTTSYSTEPEGILRSTQETREAYSGTGTPPGGSAGGLDVPTYTTSGTGESSYSRSESIRNYEVDQETRETIVMPGSIKSLSVAVILNRNLDDKERSVISETVSAALGLDPLRQDRISVTGILFDTSLAKRLDQALAPDSKVPGRWHIYALAVGAALVLGTLIILQLRRSRRAEESSPGPALVEPEVIISPETLARQRSRETAERMASSDPQSVASLVKSWLMEDEGNVRV